MPVKNYASFTLNNMTWKDCCSETRAGQHAKRCCPTGFHVFGPNRCPTFLFGNTVSPAQDTHLTSWNIIHCYFFVAL